MKPDPDYHRDDIVTIAIALKRLEPHPPTRDAFHKATNRGKFKKLPDQAGNDVRYRWGDILDYMAAGGFKKCGPLSAPPSDTATSHKLDEKVKPATYELMIIAPTSIAETCADQAPVDTITVEVLPKETKSTNGMLPELEEINKLLVDLPTLTVEDCIPRIKNYSDRAEMRAKEAVAVASQAVICAWACGTLLNKAKLKCGHGKFTLWPEEHILSSGISIKTCERYMSLARKQPCIRSLIESGFGLTDAYVACGILPEPVKPRDKADDSDGDTAQGSDHPSSVKSLMSCATTLQKRLRKFSASGEILSTPDLDKLGEVINELTGVLAQIQQQSTDKNQTAA